MTGPLATLAGALRKHGGKVGPAASELTGGEFSPQQMLESLNGIRKEMDSEENQIAMMGLKGIQELRNKFGQFYPSQGVEGAGPVTSKKEDTAIVNFISQRKAYLMSYDPQDPDKKVYSPDTAHAQAVAEARVMFPHVHPAAILHALGKPGMESLPKEKYGVWIGPDRAAAMSNKRISQILKNKAYRGQTLAVAREYKSLAGRAANLDGFIAHLRDWLVSAGEMTDVEARNAIRRSSQHISVAAAQLGLF